MKGQAVFIVIAALSVCACGNKTTSGAGSSGATSGSGGSGSNTRGGQTSGSSGTTLSSSGSSGGTPSSGTPVGGPVGGDDGGGDATVASGDGGNLDGGAGDGGGQDGATDPKFAACVGALMPNCDVAKMNTADEIQTPCASLTFIPIPLADGGGAYGPVTLMGGPYGGKIEWNQGKGTSFVNQVNGLENVCIPTGIETFAQPASVNAQIENLRGMDWSLYTIFRPACMKDGEKYPVITWANGTCGETDGYAVLLATLASYGYVIVAANSTWTATSPTDKVQLRALDYAKSLNEDQYSIFYQHLDMDKIGAMGHSQGAFATANASSDSRIKALLFWNTGTSNNKPFLDVSGEHDVVSTTPSSMASDVADASQPGAWIYYHKVLNTGGNNTGHLLLMEQPDRVWNLALSWWNYVLKGDMDAKKMFVGSSCGLCNSPDDYEYGHNSLLQ